MQVEKLVESLQDYASLLDGKLLRREEIPIDDQTVEQLLNEKLLQRKPALKKSLFTILCNRCGNKSSHLFAEIPCARCKKNHFYCRKCIEMGRLMECDFLYYWNGPKALWRNYENPCSWDGKLTPHQNHAANRIKEAVIKGEKAILSWSVCGAGKTEMIFPAITIALQKGLRICIATPRADVVRELKPRLQEAFQSVPIQTLYGGSDEKEGNSQLIIATTHQLLRFKHAFDVMIIDEVDAFPFHADPSLPFAQKRAAKLTATTIYLTATPRKEFKKEIRKGCLSSVFVPVRYHGHPLPIPTLKICPSLQKDLEASKIPAPFSTWFQKRKKPERQLLIFVPTIKLVEKLKKPFTKFFLENGYIKSVEQLDAVFADDKKREEKVLAFRKKKLKVIITTTILERGVTFPSVDVAILDAGHEVFDEAALVQIAGRAGRDALDPTGEVIFFHDGKTERMLEAVYSIRQMNKRGGF